MDRELEVTAPHDHAAGWVGVAVSMRRSLEHMGSVRAARTLLRLNQAEGFDCMSCAWPDPEPGHRHTAEFCESGAKAVAEEATKARATPEFFAAHSIADLDAESEHWLGQQGRITHPMIKRPGGTHYEPIEWDDALALIGRELNALASPDEAIFYTSGRTSTRPPSPISSSSARTGRTTCPTARTCVTSRPASLWLSRSASARPA